MRRLGTVALALFLAALVGAGCAHRAFRLPALGASAAPPPADAGPTLSLAVWRAGDAGIPAGDFMYFIPLISPEPVACHVSPANGMRARLVAVERCDAAGGGFALSCRFELVGDGFIEHEIDHAPMATRNAEPLRGGGRLNNLLGSIRMEGEGIATLQAEGSFAGGVPVVEKVSIAFAGRGARSPIRIELDTITGPPDAWVARTESLADVASLSFTRSGAPTRMGVTLAGLRDPGAGDGLAERLKAAIKGTVANLLVPPLDIEATGNAAMLDFAAALVTGAPTFTFPRAVNLRPDSAGHASAAPPCPTGR